MTAGRRKEDALRTSRRRPALRLGRAGLWGLVGLFVAVALWGAGATAVLVFGGNRAAEVVGRIARVQAQFEDRITVLRTQLDRLERERRLYSSSVANRLQELNRRQSAVEADYQHLLMDLSKK